MKTIQIKQIAVAGDEETLFLYGLGIDGVVYEYNWFKKKWEPLSAEVLDGQR